MCLKEHSDGKLLSTGEAHSETQASSATSIYILEMYHVTVSEDLILTI